MEPLIIVIFGASGDLTERKLIPAIFQLYRNKSLPEHFAVLGVSRSALSNEDFRKKMIESEHFKTNGSDPNFISQFAQKLFYEAIDTSDASAYGAVKARLDKLDAEHQTLGNYIFYLSTPPKLYETIPGYLATHGLNDQTKGYKRLIIEKPFGYDAQSAFALNKKLLQHFEEDQIYRIDHYLGKETVQNLLVTRFSNGFFEPLWNRNYIQHVEITNAENIGVENRGGYYDQSGALRDMFQNHLLQIVAHIAMEPPTTADAKAIRNEKLKLFQSIRPILGKDIPTYSIRGQYIASKIKGVPIFGYRDEQGVPEDSKTETFSAIKFYIDNWRWADVPFYVRTGKRLPTKVTEVVITFKSPPHALFYNETGLKSKNNKLIIRIQPHEGLLLNFGMKVPGEGFRVKDVDMDFHYADLTDAYVPEAYERLLLDSIKGDPTLYARGDSVEAAWNFVDPILSAWKNDPTIKLFGYPAGTWGPKEADSLIAESAINWRNPCKNLTEAGGFCEL
ncbi:MAG: glucose-6-phosphate dehydrogenase [Saprospiraceae bacterium]